MKRKISLLKKYFLFLVFQFNVVSSSKFLKVDVCSHHGKMENERKHETNITGVAY